MHPPACHPEAAVFAGEGSVHSRICALAGSGVAAAECMGSRFAQDDKGQSSERLRLDVYFCSCTSPMPTIFDDVRNFL